MAGSITPKKVAQSEVQIPDTGYVTIFVDSSDGIPKFKDSLGVVHTFTDITFQDGTHSITDDNLHLNPSQFYLTQDSSGNPVLNISNVASSGVTDHGSLTGLLDDDHPQYARKAAAENNFDGVIVAEAFYVTGAANIYNDGSGNTILDSGQRYIRSTNNLIAGDPGSEGDGVTVGGVTFTSSLKVSSIDDVDIGQIHIHRHSAALPATLIATRSDAVGATHADVDDGDGLFTLHVSGRNGSTYEIAAQIEATVDGVPGSGFVPGRINFRTNKGANTGLTPDLAMSIRSGGHVRMENTLEVNNAVTAEAFYIKNGGELLPGIFVSDGTQTLFDNTLKFNKNQFYLTQDSQGNPEVNSVFPTVQFTVQDGVHSLSDDTLIFSRGDFYLTQDSQGNPVVNSKATTGLTSVVFSDGVRSFSDDTLKFNKDQFYLTQDSSGNPSVNVVFPTPPTIAITFKDGVRTLTDDTVSFNKDQFYLTQDSQGNPEVNVVFPPSPSTTITVSDGVRSFTDDNLKFNLNQFYLTQDSAGNPEVNVVFPNPDLVTFSDSVHTISDDTLKFNIRHFYLTQDSQGNPLLNIQRDFYEKSMTLLYPNTIDKYDWFVPMRDITVEQVHSLLRTQDSGFYPYAQWSVRFSSDPFSQSPSELVTGGTRTGFYMGSMITDVVTFNNNIIPRDNQVWVQVLKLGEGDGTEKSLHLTLKYR